MANLTHAEGDPKHVKIPNEVAPCAQAPPTGPTRPPCLVPSFADACQLVSAPYSCLVLDTHRRHIALSPMYMKKKKTGIQDELNTELLKYSERLKGVPLAYNNIRILGQMGDIYDDSGYIHLNIEANFVIFQPQTGQKLLGVVNKLGINHAGCLVHGCFNASVPKPSLVSVDTWKEAGPVIGAELEFEVTQLDADTAGVLLIRGRLDRTRVQELLAVGEHSEANAQEGNSEQPEPESTLEQATEPSQDSPDGAPKKKKKKKKQKEESEVAVTLHPAGQPEGAASRELNGVLDSPAEEEEEEQRKKKKKKKKDKLQKEEPEDVAVCPAEAHGSDSSGYISNGPSRKRQRAAEGDKAPPPTNGDGDTPKTKKKRKSDSQQVV